MSVDKKISHKRPSEWFGFVCKHCGDPRATHERPGFNGLWGGCFVSSCNCRGFELDNLKYLEQIADDN